MAERTRGHLRLVSNEIETLEGKLPDVFTEDALNISVHAKAIFNKRLSPSVKSVGDMTPRRLHRLPVFERVSSRSSHALGAVVIRGDVTERFRYSGLAADKLQEGHTGFGRRQLLRHFAVTHVVASVVALRPEINLRLMQQFASNPEPLYSRTRFEWQAASALALEHVISPTYEHYTREWLSQVKDAMNRDYAEEMLAIADIGRETGYTPPANSYSVPPQIVGVFNPLTSEQLAQFLS